MRELSIGKVKISGFAALAPMASVADRAYREMCKEQGAAFLTSEMISSKGLVYGDKKTPALCEITDPERPMALQLFGEDPLFMAKAAEKLLAFSPDIIDINMGCPVPKIVSNGSGSALMRDTPRAVKTVSEVVSAAAGTPVTVKLRSGWDKDSINAPELSRALEQAGAAAITVHARTRMQMYSGKADYSVIKAVKQAVSIPVIGNGDVIDGKSAERMYKETGCDFIAIGRASYGNPFLFREINAYLGGGEVKPPDIEERIAAMLLHTRKIVFYKGEKQGIREARKNIAWYTKGLPNSAKLRAKAGEIVSMEDALKICEEIKIASGVH